MRGVMDRVAGLRIAQLIEVDAPGGAQRIIVELVTALQAAGAYNVVFVPADGEGWLAKQLTGSGVAIEYFRIDRPVSAECARGLEEAFRRHRIMVAHSHEFSMAVYGGWTSWRVKVPHVITMHGIRYYAGRLQRRLALRAAIAASHQTVAVSSALARALSEDLWMPQSKVTVLANGVRYTAPERVTLRDELRLGAADRLVLAVGSLYPVKGHCHLIDAAALLMERHPTLHVAIAGRGEMADSLRAQAQGLGIEHRVHLLGLRDDVAAILAAADVFVMPSLSEGLPLAMLEAMWAGRPIVATAVGDVPVALRNGEVGQLVKAGDAAALAEGLHRVLADAGYARHLADGAARRARADYDVTKMIERYFEIYDQSIRVRMPVGAGGLTVTPNEQSCV